MKLHTPLLFAVALQLAAFGAAGCKRSSDSSDESSTNPAAAEVDPANATDVGPTAATDPLPAPPEAKEEAPGTAPSDHHVWIDGYWWWDLPHRVYAWSPGYWQDRLAEATVAPPELLYEYPGRAPSALYLYVPGYWMWHGNEYVWHHGHWGVHRDGWAYVHPYWESRGGHYGCAAWGWERYHADWNTHHAGWEYHAGVWERPAEFQARVTIARAHAADFRVEPGTWHGHVSGRADVEVHGPAGTYPGDTVHVNAHAGGHAKAEEHPAGHAPEGHAEGHTPEGHTAEPSKPGHPHYDTHPPEGHHQNAHKP